MKRRDIEFDVWKRGAALAGCVAMACLSHWAAAQQPHPVPTTLNFQGLVYLENGSTEVTGTYDMEFRLYDAAVGGNLLWGEKLTGVRLFNGHFNVLLGNGAEVEDAPHDPLPRVFRGSEVYIEFTTNAGNTVKARQQFVTAPYALSARNAVNAVHGVPPGTVMPFAGAVVPYGWLACDGAAYAKSQYPALYAALCDAGTCIWGEDADRFNVPNLGGRALAGADSGHAVGVRRGEEKHALTSDELPEHDHGYYDKHWNGTTQSVYRIWPNNDWSCADNNSANTPGTTSATGASAPHNNTQPSAVVKFMIKY